MNITVLMENTSAAPEIQAEHGLSLYVETDRHNLLFDSGQTALFAENAERLGVDLREIDLAVISHGHYDHGGGLHRFLEINHLAPVYISRYAFELHFSGTRENGLDPALVDSGRLLFVEDEHKIDDGLTLYSCNGMPRKYDMGSFGLNVLEQGEMQPDDFRHEQYLLIEEDGKRILLSGCSHKGILNIVEWFKPDVLIGGFHLMKLDPEKPEDAAILDETAHKLSSYDTVYYTCHCTGEAQYAYLKARMGDQLHYAAAGDRLTL